jgi:hypothetical protein
MYSSNHDYHNKFISERNPIPPSSNLIYYSLFTKSTIDKISSEITTRLAGVHPEGKNIIVGNDQIISVLDSYYNGYRKDPQVLIMMTISHIVEQIKSEFQIESQNSKLDIWITNYPEQSGIRQHSEIKLNKRRPTNFEFHYTN